MSYINVGKYRLNMPVSTGLPTGGTGNTAMPGTFMPKSENIWEADADLIPLDPYIDKSKLKARQRKAYEKRKRQFEQAVAERMPEWVSYDHATRTYTFDGNGAGPSGKP